MALWSIPLVLSAGILATQTDAAGLSSFSKPAFIQPAPLDSSLRSTPHAHGSRLTTSMSAASSSCLFAARPRRSSSALHAASLSVSGDDDSGPAWWQFWSKARAVPPASKSEVIKSELSKQPPVYGSLDHSDVYLEACRFLGVSTEVDEEELAKKVETLQEKYKGDRKKQIQINWNYDRVTEHRLYMNMHGIEQVSEQVLAEEPNLFKLLNEGSLDVDDADLQKVKNLLGMGYRAQASSGTPQWVKNARRSPLANLVRPSFYAGVLGFIKMVLEESFQKPKLKFIVWPPGISYIMNIYWMKTLLDQPRVAYPAIVASQALWVYIRGISPTPGLQPGEKEPIKWRRIFASLVCASAATFGGYIFSILWLLLGFPIGDLPLDAFTMFVVSTGAWVGSGCFFIRDSILGYAVSKRKSDD